MLSCETCQAQLLDHLYDLLEDDERGVFEQHLQACPACQAALAQAQEQKRLLATAARLQFPDVRFTAPTAPAASEQPTTSISSEPTPDPDHTSKSTPATVLPLPDPGRIRRRWLFAAAVVFALAGLGAPAAWYGNEYLQTKGQVSAHNKVIAQARDKVSETKQALIQVQQEKQKKIQEVRQDVQKRQIKMVVVGPTSVQAGAPTKYRVQTTDPFNRPVPAQVTAQLAMAGEKKETNLATRKIQRGQYEVTVPADQGPRPGKQLSLVVHAKREDGVQTELKEKLELAAPVYVTHLTTDKPMYQLGEVVRFRSLTLDRFSLKPASEQLYLQYVLKSPLGEERVILRGTSSPVQKKGGASLLDARGEPIQGVGAGKYQLRPEDAGGEYTLIVREERGRFPEQKRSFIVNKYQKPRLNKKVDFNRKTYGPGDKVIARLELTHARGGPVVNQPVQVRVQIDGKSYDAKGKESGKRFTFRTDNKGIANVDFTLPKQIDMGRGSLTLTCTDGGSVEQVIKPIPIVLKKLLVDFYPEGGDLVAGIRNRVYFEVRTTLGKPAELKGQLLADGKEMPVRAETLNDDKLPGVNQGMGVFAFIPEVGKRYELRVDSPRGITQRFALPAIKPQGVVMHIPNGVVQADGKITVELQSTQKKALLVGAYCRGRLLDSLRLEVGPEKRQAVLEPTSGAGGVCRVTVFEEFKAEGNRRQLRPVAERLMYRHPKQRLKLAVKTDKKSYIPGDRVTLNVQASREDGKDVSALVMVRVVDKSVVTLADEKTYRSMPTHFLLTTEVRRPEDLEYADFLLGPHPKAERALDLLLGTQGWRRFAEQNPQEFRKQHKEDAARLLVTIGQSSADRGRRTDFVAEKIRTIQEEAERKTKELQQQLASAQTEYNTASADQDHKEAKALLVKYQRFFDNAWPLAAPVLGLVLVVVALVLMILAATRQFRRVVPVYLAAGTCWVLVIVLVFTYPFSLVMRQAGLEKQYAATAERQARKAARNLAKAEERRKWNMKDGAKDGADRFREEKEAPGIGGAVPPQAAPPRGLALPEPAARRPAAPVPAKPAEPGDQFARKPKLDAAGAKKGRMRGKALQQDKARKNALAPGRGALAKQARRAQDENARALREAPGMKRMPPRIAAGGLAPEMPLPGKDRFRRRQRIVSPPLVVREYAHTRLETDQAQERSDFTETLYWHPVLVVPDGEAKVSFQLCDSVTTFEATAYGHTTNGRLGAGKCEVVSRLPFTLQPKVPQEVTASDVLAIPLSVSNNTGEERTVQLTLDRHEGFSLLEGDKEQQFVIPANKAIRKVFRLRPTLKDGKGLLTFKGQAGAFTDAITVPVHIAPEGFPVVASRSEMLESSAVETVLLPKSWVKGTLQCKVDVYPSTLADLQKGLESLLREPHGCFEQTSTSNYPNLLILDYLQQTDQTKPAVERRARDLLAKGYGKLTSFECKVRGDSKRRGYEWFGGYAPPHEALTAYGLLQFRDMARVRDVDAEMVQRTRNYLMSRKDGKGGFQRNRKALDSFGRAPQHITDAYIVWALTESGKDDDVSMELNALVDQAKTSNDPYFLALVGNSLLNRARREEGVQLLRKVVESQKEDGRVTGASTSITRSGGRTLEIETTALAVLGWLKSSVGEFNKPVQKAVQWIGKQRGGYGGFGSTQSTILALKALIAHAKANKKTPEAGELRLLVDDKQVANLPFEAGVADTLTLAIPEPAKTLKPGKNRVRVEITGKNVFPYTLSWSYHTRQPASVEGCAVGLQTSLDRKEAREGDSVRLTVQVSNNSKTPQGMTTAIVGLPGGLTLPEDMKQLKEYARVPKDGSQPLIGAFEVRSNGRELVLYWRAMKPGQKVEVPIDLMCRVPGQYTGPASRAYLYYNADLKHWIEPLQVTIQAK